MIQPLARRFARLETARAAIEADLKTLNERQLAFREREGTWSIGEVLDHVVRVERAVLDGARRPGVDRTRWRPRPLRRIITWIVFAVGARIRIPQRVRHVTPAPDARADEALARWREVRREMSAFLDTVPLAQLRLLAIRHPIAGPFSYRDFLAFLDWHLRHHRRQIRRIRSGRNFPR